MTSSQQIFIDKIKFAAQNLQRKYFIPASVCIGQAILESGWGKSILSSQANNYFGIKATTKMSQYQSGSISLSTLEYFFGDTAPTTITDAFRTYRSIEDGLLDYGEFLFSNSRYFGAFRYQTNPQMFITEVARGGYATDPKYAEKVWSIIQQYNLTQYDVISILPPEATPVVITPTSVVPEEEIPTTVRAPKFHIPEYYPYAQNGFTLTALQKAAKVEELTGDDYDQRLQALISLASLGHIDHWLPDRNETWVSLFTTAWKNWQLSPKYTGLNKDGIPDDASARILAAEINLPYSVGIPKIEPLPVVIPSVTEGRHIPEYYPYSDTLTLQRLVRASKQEVLTGLDYDHRLQALDALMALGLCDHVVPVAGETWLSLFKGSWQKWQKNLGYSGADADGVPGEDSTYKLALTAKLAYWDDATKSSVPTAGKLSNPTDGGSITTPFAKLPNNNTYWQSFKKHTGADFARSVCKSDAIFAVDSGTVTYKWSSVLGHMAILEADTASGGKKFWRYCHLASRPTTGRVARGQRIGTMGKTGTGASGNHLHIELSDGPVWPTRWEQFADPGAYVSTR